MSFQKCNDTEDRYAKVEIVAAIGTCEIHRHKIAVLVYDRRATRSLHGRNAVNYSVAIGSLGYCAHCELSVDAMVCLGQGNTLIETYHVELLRYFHVFLVGVKLGIIEYILAFWSLLAFELQKRKV